MSFYVGLLVTHFLFVIYAVVEEDAAQPVATTQQTATLGESFGEPKRNQTTQILS